jgi:hypothetical protein
MQKVLFVTPHLSTGGCPQYLLKKLQTYKDQIEAYVVEYSFLGNAYVVQRNAIIELLPEKNFFSLGERKEELLEIIDQVAPDIIHFEEISETMCSYDMLEHIYLKPNRSYFITETTHSSQSNPEHKIYLPDRFIFASKFSLKQFEKLNVPSTIWEYPIDDNLRPERKTALKALGLDPNKVHILNVGLFTPGKNQGELIQLAEQFKDCVFHFVGNQAPNFESYWGPLMENLPKNCIIWGERTDVENFMNSCDIFYFSSKFELNPLVVKEALSWKLPVIMYNLQTYMGAYDSVNDVHFIDGSNNAEVLKELIIKQEQNICHRAKIVHIVSDLESEIDQKSISSVSRLAEQGYEYTIHLNPVTRKFNPTKPPLFENPALKPGHFGCFEAFRKAITEDFTEDFDFLIVCERDCIIEEYDSMISILPRVFNAMNRHGIGYFSLGDKVDLDNGFLQSERIEDIEEFGFVTNKIIGLQFIIFSKAEITFLKNEFDTRAWYGMDIWLNVVYEEAHRKMGIINKRLTTQLDGYSLIDEVEKKFKMNNQ